MQIVLHIGVHKTASTYLQAVLEASRNRLRAEGIGYVTLEEMRSGITARVRRPGLFGSRLKSIARRLVKQHAGCRRLIISDENLSGGSRELIKGTFCSAAGERTSGFAEALGIHDVSIMVATRSYDSFVSSCYCEHLRHFSFVTPAAYVAAIDIHRLDWAMLIADLCRRFGQERVTVWRFEDFREVEDDVLSAMTGGAAVHWIKPAGSVRPSFSQKAIDALTALLPLLGRKQVSALVEPVAQAMARSDCATFRAYDDETASALRARYDRDMARLESEFPKMRLIRPASSGVKHPPGLGHVAECDAGHEADS